MNNNVSNLVVDNQNLIYSISHYFKGYQNKDDLFQVGVIGLINAHKNFDEPINTGESKDISLYDTIAEVDNLDLNSLIALKEEIKKLDNVEQNIIQMRYFEDFTQTEVANALGINQVQVSRKEKKILEKLRNQLNE
ncbi:MAG TPA: sigma-70 family RNA polymerase sigma factor [Mollicutes bacterium]|nr:sigma-70 family RNA polymerase sigma factor [Mollicutes bacterium]